MENNSKIIAEIINSKAKEAHQGITKFLNNHQLQEICYAYKSRVKAKENLLEKVARKLEGKPDYNIHDISDVIGIRFIVLFKQDIIPAIESILSMLVSNNEVGNPFKNSNIIESIYYKGNVSNSTISTEIRKKFTDINKDIEETVSPEGYSSIHIVCELCTEQSDILRDNYRLPVEIQVRTIFEDAWGE